MASPKKSIAPACGRQAKRIEHSVIGIRHIKIMTLTIQKSVNDDKDGIERYQVNNFDARNILKIFMGLS